MKGATFTVDALSAAESDSGHRADLHDYRFADALHRVLKRGRSASRRSLRLLPRGPSGTSRSAMANSPRIAGGPSRTRTIATSSTRTMPGLGQEDVSSSRRESWSTASSWRGGGGGGGGGSHRGSIRDAHLLGSYFYKDGTGKRSSSPRSARQTRSDRRSPWNRTRCRFPAE